MKLRIAKKVLLDPDQYSGQQRYAAAHRLFRRASTFKDGSAGYAALMLKPQRSYHEDDQLDLRMESFQADLDAGREPVFEPGEVVVPPVDQKKPVFRRDGQVHNFNALPFPNKVTWKQRLVVIGKDEEGYDIIESHNEIDRVEMERTFWEMGEERVVRRYSLKKYQVRTKGADRGKRPYRLKWSKDASGRVTGFQRA
jgi:hypothetical protein